MSESIHLIFYRTAGRKLLTHRGLARCGLEFGDARKEISIIMQVADRTTFALLIAAEGFA